MQAFKFCMKKAVTVAKDGDNKIANRERMFRDKTTKKRGDSPMVTFRRKEGDGNSNMGRPLDFGSFYKAPICSLPSNPMYVLKNNLLKKLLVNLALRQHKLKKRFENP